MTVSHIIRDTVGNTACVCDSILANLLQLQAMNSVSNRMGWSSTGVTADVCDDDNYKGKWQWY